MRVYFLDRLGWPIETVRGRYVQNTIRRIIHTRRLTTKRPAALSPPHQGEPPTAEPMEGQR